MIINSFLNQQHQIWLTFNNNLPLKNAIFTSNMWDEQTYDTLPIDQVSGDELDSLESIVVSTYSSFSFSISYKIHLNIFPSQSYFYFS